MRRLRRACRHIPRIAQHVFVLTDQAERTESRVLPKGPDESPSDFVERAILAVRRARESITNARCTVGVEQCVASDVDSAIVGEELPRSARELDAVDGAIGVNRAQRTVGTHGHVRRLTKKIAAATVAEEIRGDHTEYFEQFTARAEQQSAALR